MYSRDLLSGLRRSGLLVIHYGGSVLRPVSGIYVLWLGFNALLLTYREVKGRRKENT